MRRSSQDEVLVLGGWVRAQVEDGTLARGKETSHREAPWQEAGSLLSEGLKGSRTAPPGTDSGHTAPTPLPSVEHGAPSLVSVLILCICGQIPLGHPLCLRHPGISPHIQPESCASLMSDQVLRSPRPDLFQHCAPADPSPGSEESLPRRSILGLYLDPLQPCWDSFSWGWGF